MKRLIILTGVASLIAIALYYRSCAPRPGDVIETWETTAKPFKIGVVARIEKKAMVSGGYYTFQAMPDGQSDWREIMTFRHDDPVEIPKDQVNYVTERIAYMFMGWMYAVTTDGGEHWSVWDAKRDLPDWQCCNYGLIESVELNGEGIGTMKLRVISGRRGEVPQLRTSDYGRSWFK